MYSDIQLPGQDPAAVCIGVVQSNHRRQKNAVVGVRTAAQSEVVNGFGKMGIWPTGQLPRLTI